jgi:hypothetical protein
MKLIKKIFAGTTLAVAMASSQAALITPSTGDGELMVVLYNLANNNSLVVDLGKTLSTFDTALNQTFSLSSSPYWSTFIGSAGNNPITYAVLGADSTGPINGVVGAKNLFVTALSGSAPANISNTTLSTRAGNFNTFQGNLNNGPTGPTYSFNHDTATDGSSLDTTSGTNTSFSFLSNNLASSLTMVATTAAAELFQYTTSAGTSGANATIVDFYSATETPTNTGGVFSVNQATGVLSYLGDPGVVVNPVPEASEWAMMLSGLGMLGLMVRRRRNNI